MLEMDPMKRMSANDVYNFVAHRGHGLVIPYVTAKNSKGLKKRGIIAKLFGLST